MNFVKSMVSVSLLTVVVLTAGCNSSETTQQSVVQAQQRQQPVQQAASQQKYDYSIRPIGREANYPIYPIVGELDDLNYPIGNEMYAPADIMKALPPIRAEHVNQGGYRCEFLCVNDKDQVVGWNPVYAELSKKQ